MGNRILRPNNAEKANIKIVQRPPIEASIVRTVCVLYSCDTTKPAPPGEIPHPGYKTVILWY
jgi:hypothetical protein